MYYATFSTDNGTTGGPWEDSSREQSIKDIREIAEGNTPAGGNCRWEVTDEAGEVVAAGGLRNGKRYRSHGGRREGAGRKTDSPRVTLSVRVTRETREALDRLRAPGESTGQLIDRMVGTYTREG